MKKTLMEVTEEFGSLGIYDDQTTPDKMEELMYQAVHNQFVACAKVKELGKKIDPEAHLGTMIADGIMYPTTCKPKDVVMTLKKKQDAGILLPRCPVKRRIPGLCLEVFCGKRHSS